MQKSFLQHSEEQAKKIVHPKRNFITEWVHLLTMASFNEYGFVVSAEIMARYIKRASDILDHLPRTQGTADTLLRLWRQKEALLIEASSLQSYNKKHEKFSKLETSGLIEKTSKIVVSLLSNGRLASMHAALAYKMRRFHSNVSSLLIWINEDRIAKKRA